MAQSSIGLLIDSWCKVRQSHATFCKCVVILTNFSILGGDIVFNNGQGSISIYGEHFKDEYKAIKHSGPGFIGMANHGENTNGCQFYITTIALPWLDGKHTVFGKVVEGQGYIHHLEKVKS
jgi:cyclophilin family peptidyl-prolyl cis-trans isomerase